MRKHNADQTKVKHIFAERGVINAIVRPTIQETNIEDDCTTDAIECGANDVDVFDVAQRYVTFFCEPETLLGVKTQLERLGYQVENSDIVYEPSQMALISAAERVDYEKFKEKLMAIDGFDDVFDNIADDADN